MGYVLRVRFAAFFAGAAVASAGGLYLLHKDYKTAHHSLSEQTCAVLGTSNCVGYSPKGCPFCLVHQQRFNFYNLSFGQMNDVYESLNGRISALERLKKADAAKHVEATE